MLKFVIDLSLDTFLYAINKNIWLYNFMSGPSERRNFCNSNFL